MRKLELKGVQPPSSKPKSLKRIKRRLSEDTKIITANAGSSGEGYLSMAISVPNGYHFSKVRFPNPRLLFCFLSVVFLLFTTAGPFYGLLIFVHKMQVLDLSFHSSEPLKYDNSFNPSASLFLTFFFFFLNISLLLKKLESYL